MKASVPAGPGLFDAPPTAPYVRGNAESRAAADSVRHALAGLRTEVYKLVRAAGHEGVTCDQIETSLDLPHQTVSPRVMELRVSGWIKDSGRKRKTRSGRNAAVYVVGKSAP